MPLVTPDLSQVKMRLSPDIYDVTVHDTNWETSTNGNPMLVVTFDIATGGRTHAYFLINDQGKRNLSKLLAACGFWDASRHLAASDVPEFEPDDMIECRLRIIVDSQGFPYDYYKAATL